MKEMLRYGFILAIICTVASGLLATVNSLTQSRILAQEQAEEEASLKEVIFGAEHFEAVKSGEEILYFKALDKEARLVGVAFKVSGKGYSSNIQTMVGMAPDGTLTAIKILEQSETPGLGAQVTLDSFTRQFRNRKNLNEIQAVTGATISSRAVIDSVKKRAAEIQALIKNAP